MNVAEDKGVHRITDASWEEFAAWLESVDAPKLQVEVNDTGFRFDTPRERLCWCLGFETGAKTTESVQASLDWLRLFIESKTAEDEDDRNDAVRRMNIMAARANPTVIQELGRGLDQWMTCLASK